ncbi:hypothetical protein RDABS01_028107 [Bienertia sinuspersici]
MELFYSSSTKTG